MNIEKNVLGRGKGGFFNRENGQHRIEYRGGKKSVPMCRDTAVYFAAIYGGKVISK